MRRLETITVRAGRCDEPNDVCLSPVGVDLDGDPCHYIVDHKLIDHYTVGAHRDCYQRAQKI